MSNLIKSSSVITLEQLKQLEWLHQRNVEMHEPLDQEADIEPVPDEETISLRDQILNDAQLYAEERLREAAQESERLLAETQQQIDVWWLQRRTDDEAAAEASRQAGYELGYAEGAAQSETELREIWEHKLSEASDVLKTAL